MKPVVAVVEDEASIRAFVALIVRDLGCAVEEYMDGKDFLDRYHPRPGCVVLNLLMPRMNGMQVLEQMAVRGWSVPVVTTSGQCRHPEAGEVLNLGAVAHVEKP